MLKIIFFTIAFLFINSASTNPMETLKGKSQFDYIKIQLDKYCYSCPEKSLQSFEKTTIELEKIILLNSKNEKLIDKEILLTDSYEQLIYDFYNNNKSKQATYRTKQYKLLEQFIERGKTEKEIIFFAKKLAEAYIREWHATNKTFDDPEYLVYKKKVNKLTKDMRSYVKKIKAQAPNKIKDLNKRANNLALTNEDLRLIDEIVNEIFEISSRPTREKKVYIEHLINALMNVVKLNQLSRDQFSRISRSAIILQSYYFASKWKSLDGIIWWCEVRSIKDVTGQLQFLNNQMISNRKLDALKMLVELGEVKIIEKWSEKLTFENSKTIFILALKQAKLRQATIRNNKKLAKLFKQEFSQSLAEIIQSKLFDRPQYQQHIQWLIIQIGTHKQNKKFKQLLKNLAQNNLYYSKQETKKLSQTEKQKLTKEIEVQLKISDDANFILNSDGDEKN